MCMSVVVRFARLICYSMIMRSVACDPVKRDTIRDEDVKRHVEVDMLNGVRRFASEMLEECSTCALQIFRRKERRVRVRISKGPLVDIPRFIPTTSSSSPISSVFPFVFLDILE